MYDEFGEERSTGIKILLFFRGLICVAACIATVLVGLYFYSNQKADKVNANILATLEEKQGQPVINMSDDSAEYEGKYDFADKAPVVDFESLREINEDCVAWIYGCEGTINYPVVQSRDNVDYLVTAIDGSDTKAGSIFVDRTVREPFEQFNTRVYGHNMKNGSMFHSLLKYKKEDYYQAHPAFVITTPDGTYQYEIFAACFMTKDALPMFSGSNNNRDRKDYLDSVLACSLYDTGVFVNAEDKLVELMTCEYSGNNNRMVVYAKRSDSVKWGMTQAKNGK